MLSGFPNAIALVSRGCKERSGTQGFGALDSDHWDMTDMTCDRCAVRGWVKKAFCKQIRGQDSIRHSCEQRGNALTLTLTLTLSQRVREYVSHPLRLRMDSNTHQVMGSADGTCVMPGSVHEQGDLVFVKGVVDMGKNQLPD